MEPTNPRLLIQNQEWVINISRTLEEALNEKTDDEGVVVSIFNVPKTLTSSKPEAYTPQVVALGPYHRRRPELLEMERYKLASAKRVQRSFRDKTKRLGDVVRRFKENDSRIRGCYHRFLQEFDRETLAWVLAIDASFLLEYLDTYSVCRWREYLFGDSRLTRVPSKMAHLIDCARSKTAHHAILRDIVMLENQIPLFLIRELHGFINCNDNDHDHHRNPDEVLAKILFGFCKDLSPFKFVDIRNFKSADQESCLRKSHLLEILYSVVVPKTLLPSEQVDQPDEAKDDDGKENDDNSNTNKNDTGYGHMNWVIQALKMFLTVLSFVLWAPIYLLKKIHNSKTIMFILLLPFKVMVRICRLKTKSSAVQNFISSADKLAEDVESIFVEGNPTDDSPLMEEISIPSVSEMSKIGVKFVPENIGGLAAIKFDKASGKFHLPVVHLDGNSDVVLRNLVAYEASAAEVEAVEFTRYTELMNGIIDTEEDARVLREAGVVVNRLKSDLEVAALWNGMTRSVRMTRVRVLDKAIEEANAYYWGSWRVRMKVAMKKYVFRSWPILVFLAANAMLLFSALQAGCSLYNCSRWLHSEI